MHPLAGILQLTHVIDDEPATANVINGTKLEGVAMAFQLGQDRRLTL